MSQPQTKSKPNRKQHSKNSSSNRKMKRKPNSYLSPAEMKELNPNQKKLQKQMTVIRTAMKRDLRAEPNQAVRKILQMIMDPEDSPPVRLSTVGSYRTALANPKTPLRASYGGGTLLSTTQACAFGFRSCFRSFVTVLIPTTNWSYTAQGRFPINDQTLVVPDTVMFLDTHSQLLGGGNTQFPEISYFSPDDNVAPHGDALFTGGLPTFAQQGVYVGPLDTLIVNFTGVAITTLAGNIAAYLYKEGSWVRVGTYPFTTTAAKIIKDGTSNAAGYYAVGFELNTFVGTAIGVSITVSGQSGSEVWAHRSSAGVRSILPSIGANRVLAKSIRLTNGAPMLDKQGFMTAWQSTGEIDWQDIATASNTFTDITSKEGSMEVHTNDKGFYGYMQPVTGADFELEELTSVNAAMNVKTIFNLNDNKNFIVVCFNVADPTNQSINLEAAEVVEFRTTSKWFDTTISHNNIATTNGALDSVKSLPMYFENPTHIRDIGKSIWNFLKKVPDFVMRYGPKIIEGASLLA